MAKRLEFSEATKREAYRLRGGKCPGLVEIRMPCGKDLEGDCEYDHIKRCEIDPDNSLENCRPLCRKCHAIKTAIDKKAMWKGRRLRGETKKSQRKKPKIKSRGFAPAGTAKALRKRIEAERQEREELRG